MLVGENGLIKQAQDAKNDTNKKGAKEEVMLEVQASYAPSKKYDVDKTKTNLETNLGINPVTKDVEGKLTFTYKGYEFEIDTTGRVTIKGEGKKPENNGPIPTKAMPANAVISKIPGEYEDIDNGIVIYIIPNGVDTKREGFWTEDKKKFNDDGELVTVG